MKKQEVTSSSSVVARHIGFFTERDGKTLSHTSMTQKHHDMGISKNVGIKATAIEKLLDDRELKHTVDNLATAYNPASSGIWDKNGNFDEKRFAELAANHIFDKGNSIITKQIFNDFLNRLYQAKPEGAGGTATHLSFLGCIPVPLSWQRITQGSINEIFEYFADYNYVTAGKSEKAFTVEGLKYFYQHPEECMEKLEKEHADNLPRKTLCPYGNR